MKERDLTRQLLENNHVMILATEVNGQPATCTVNYAYDDNFNLYWKSFKSSNHSVNLVNNSKTAVSILQDPNKKQCLHLQGEAFELSGGEAVKAQEVYSSRNGQNKIAARDEKSNDQGNHGIYVFNPTLFVLFDAANFSDSPRREWKL